MARAVISNLAPGGATVDTVLGKPVRAKIEAGKENLVELKVPAGMLIDGVVVNGSGQPIPHADITSNTNGSMGDVVKIGSADAAGRFSFEANGKGTWRNVGARADGYAYSHLHILSGPAGMKKTLEVVLDRQGGAVAGRVLGPDLEPCANAYVIVGDWKHEQFALHDGTHGCNASPVPTRTDREGRFIVRSLPLGTHPVRIRGIGMDAWSCEVEVLAGQTTEVAANLRPGATVSGVVSKANGDPAPRVRVEIGRYGDPFSSFTRTDKQGRYKLTGVGSGKRKIKAESDRLGTIIGDIETTSGESTAWNASLPITHQITGRIVDDADKPLAGFGVSTYSNAYAKSKDDGRFVLENCGAKPLTLKVTAPDAYFFPCRVLKDIKPDGPELKIVVPRADIPSGFVIGEMLDPDGNPLPGVKLQVNNELGSSGIQTSETDGRFRFGPLPAIECELRASISGRPNLYVRFTPKPDQESDLGSIRFEKGSAVTVNCTVPDGVDPKRIWATMQRIDARGRANLKQYGTTFKDPAASPGRYRLHIAALDCVNHQEEVVIKPGVAHTFAVTLEPGVSCVVQGHVEVGDLPHKANLLITDQQGRTILETQAWRSDKGLRGTFALRPGVYTVRLSTKGSKTEGTLEVAPDGNNRLDLTLPKAP